MNTASFDSYATSKTFSQKYLNIATIQMQISMLIYIFHTPGQFSGFQIALLVLIFNAILMELFIFVLLVCLANTRTENVVINRKPYSVIVINSLVTTLTGFLLINTTAINGLSAHAFSGNITAG